VRVVPRGRRAERVEDELDLVHEALAREERLAREQLAEDAADRPEVDRRVVRQVRREQQLGAAVPARDDVPVPVCIVGDVTFGLD
jgi:hypothetical protein